MGNYSTDIESVINQLIEKESGDATKTIDQKMQSIVEKLDLADKLIVFFGFQGILANHFSLIKAGDIEETKARIFIADDSINIVCMSVLEFYKFQQTNTSCTFKPIKMEDALLRLRGLYKSNGVEVEDSETEEFDDNCTEECLPGKHSCGK